MPAPHAPGSGPTLTIVTSAWPWYAPAIFTTSSRPVCARAIRIASITDSVPEFVKRQRGKPKRKDRFSATSTASSVGRPKWVPSRWRAVTAAVIAGWAWPCTIALKPLWKSRYSLPSTSQTRAPSPRVR